MISEERLDQIAEIVRRAGLNDQTLAALRDSFADMHFTRCNEDDISAGTPVRVADAFHLYLVDGRTHCMVLTADPEAATGVLLAEIDSVG
jgi:hypothetical protein